MSLAIANESVQAVVSRPSTTTDNGYQHSMVVQDKRSPQQGRTSNEKTHDNIGQLLVGEMLGHSLPIAKKISYYRIV